MDPLRVALAGTEHGHAVGNSQAAHASEHMDLVCGWEPDDHRRARFLKDAPWASELRWVDNLTTMLEREPLDAVLIETSNAESLRVAELSIQAGCHVWLDKPAGDDFHHFSSIMAAAKRSGLVVQLGYMFRTHPGFERVSALARSGELGHVFMIRAHMSTDIDNAMRAQISTHRGGILYDLGGHMVDQIVRITGRPIDVNSYFGKVVEGDDLLDNTVSVMRFRGGGLAIISIAAQELQPVARRFEVHGSKGSAIMEPFEPEASVRIRLRGSPESSEVHAFHTRYDRVLDLFAHAVRSGDRLRTAEHELLVQETLMRAAGALS